MSRENNRFNVDYACPGFCSLCHAEIAEFRGFASLENGSRPRIVALKSNFRSRTVTLDDDTSMTVSLCEDCFNISPSDCAVLMESEYKGWEMEVEHFRLPESAKQWVREAKARYVTDVPDMMWDEKTKGSITKPKGVK